jgi:hypothetical protein
MHPNSTSFLIGGGIRELSGAGFLLVEKVPGRLPCWFPIGGEGTWTAALLANRRPIPLSSPSYSIRIPFTLILLVLEKHNLNLEIVF